MNNFYSELEKNILRFDITLPKTIAGRSDGISCYDFLDELLDNLDFKFKKYENH